MSLESQVFAALKGLVANRVYPLILPQAQATPITPAIRYLFVSDGVITDICGDDGGETDDVRIQIDVYSVDFDTCRALRQQVIAAMKTFPVPNVREGGFDDYEPDTKLYRSSLDFITQPSSS